MLFDFLSTLLTEASHAPECSFVCVQPTVLPHRAPISAEVGGMGVHRGRTQVGEQPSGHQPNPVMPSRGHHIILNPSARPQSSRICPSAPLAIAVAAVPSGRSGSYGRFPSGQGQKTPTHDLFCTSHFLGSSISQFFQTPEPSLLSVVQPPWLSVQPSAMGTGTPQQGHLNHCSPPCP